MVPEGVNPKKAFEETLKFREQAAIAYRRSQAADQMSKLGNTTSRPPQVFDPGTLAMIWRERRANGRGGWQGPVRILLREGSTYWASGAALIRAKSNQLRKCSRVEETTAITNGAAVYRMPVTMETLMRGFRGKQYEDVTGLQPPKTAVEDPAQAEVKVPPRHRNGDYWEFQGDWLVRVHVQPRLAMLVPSKLKKIFVKEEDLQGERHTVVRSGGNEQIIKDDFRTHENPARCLLDRWTGETRFRFAAGHPASSARPNSGPDEASVEPRDPPESSASKRRSKEPRLASRHSKSTATASASGARAPDEASVEHRDPPESSRGPFNDEVDIPG